MTCAYRYVHRHVFCLLTESLTPVCVNTAVQQLQQPPIYGNFSFACVVGSTLFSHTLVGRFVLKLRKLTWHSAAHTLTNLIYLIVFFLNPTRICVVIIVVIHFTIIRILLYHFSFWNYLWNCYSCLQFQIVWIWIGLDVRHLTIQVRKRT